MNKKLLGLISLTAVVSCGSKPTSLELEQSEKASAEAEMKALIEALNKEILEYEVAVDANGMIKGVTKDTAAAIVTSLKSSLEGFQSAEKEIKDGNIYTTKTKEHHSKARKSMKAAHSKAHNDHKKVLSDANAKSKKAEGHHVSASANKVEKKEAAKK